MAEEGKRMTAALDVEVIELTELDLEKTPPCELIQSFWYERALLPWKIREGVCGATSVARVLLACNACGGKLRLFLCASCLKSVQNGQTGCRMCGAKKPYEFRGES
jgi:hypothetical protein